MFRLCGCAALEVFKPGDAHVKFLKTFKILVAGTFWPARLPGIMNEPRTVEEQGFGEMDHLSFRTSIVTLSTIDASQKTASDGGVLLLTPQDLTGPERVACGGIEVISPDNNQNRTVVYTSKSRREFLPSLCTRCALVGAEADKNTRINGHNPV
ncbi:hypothetical protein C8R41DRAFT_866106 [Lentinula lateritia]|uniref:Uncharacterized protein n=1 Tax=Lentinula lateritia TaxID=40482 RepID=A0ABQ8VK07_9AGAR|nr:hypothetical protein C8R41DRAFT_866106 [Lentinula lateritia]